MITFNRKSLSILLAVFTPTLVFAATGNIDTVDKWAWGEHVGWANFRPTDGGATVTPAGLYGYVWHENVGWIKLANDGNPPYANTAIDNWGVNNDGGGALSGYGWSEKAGWINFNPTDSRVTIDSNGIFHGYAWGENIGWISFNGTALDGSAYRVKTGWNAPTPTRTPTWDPLIPTWTPTPTSTTTPTATVTSTTTPTFTRVPTVTPTVTGTATPAATPSVTPTSTPTVTPTAPPTSSPTITLTPTPIDFVVNEMLYDTPHSEMVELYNSGAAPLNLTGFRLHCSVGDSLDQYYSLPAITLNPGYYIIIHWNTPGSDQPPDLYTGNSGTVTEPLQDDFGYAALFSGSPPGAATIVDYVEYGKGGLRWEAEAVQAGIWQAGDMVQIVPDDHSTGRCPNGTDTNSSTDWHDLWLITTAAANSCGLASPTPSPTITPTLSVTPTTIPSATPPPTTLPTGTPSLSPVPSATPSPAASATPLPTSTPPLNTKPLIMAGGYWETPGLAGGPLTLMAYIYDPDGLHDIDEVSILYHGAPTGIELWDDGVAGDLAPDDSLYTFSLDIPPLSAPVTDLLEINAVDRQGTESPPWPYLTITADISGTEGSGLRQLIASSQLSRPDPGDRKVIADFISARTEWNKSKQLPAPLPQQDKSLLEGLLSGRLDGVPRGPGVLEAPTKHSPDLLQPTSSQDPYIRPKENWDLGFGIWDLPIVRAPNSPEIKLAGYWNSVITTTAGGRLTMIALVVDPDGPGDIATVELYYQGIGTGIFLEDDGNHADGAPGDGVYGLTATVDPGTPSGRYLLEIIATDHSGNRSTPWPYLTIK